jgi:hypothetical protein
MTFASAGFYLEECRIVLEEDGDPRKALGKLRTAMESLEEDAPFAWGGAPKQTIGGHIKDYLKKTARHVAGIPNMAPKLAHAAHAHGQEAFKHAGHLSDTADKLSRKGDHEGAVAAHNQAVKTHQAAIQHFKHTMDQANREGDHETANWAAKAGAMHSAMRSHHMQQGSGIRQWMMKSAGHASQQRAQANAQAAHAHTQAHAAAAKPSGSVHADMYKDHMAKVAANKAHAAAQANAPASVAPITKARRKRAARKPKIAAGI